MSIFYQWVLHAKAIKKGKVIEKVGTQTHTNALKLQNLSNFFSNKDLKKSFLDVGNPRGASFFINRVTLRGNKDGWNLNPGHMDSTPHQD